MPRPRRETVLATVRAHQKALEAMGVKSLDLFGSVARDQAGQDSDVDLLVEFDRPVGLFQLFGVKHYLEDLLSCPVDLGTAKALKEHLQATVAEDAIRVF